MPGGAPQVGLIGIQPGQPAALRRTGQVNGRLLGHRQEMRAVRRRDRGGLAVVAGLDEPLGGEQPDRLQQPVPQGSPGRLGHHQALVHQRPEQIRDIQHVQAAGPAHRLGRVQAEAAGEHALGNPPWFLRLWQAVQGWSGQSVHLRRSRSLSAARFS